MIKNCSGQEITTFKMSYIFGGRGGALVSGSHEALGQISLQPQCFPWSLRFFCCFFCFLNLCSNYSLTQLVRIHLQCKRPQFDSWVGKIHQGRDRLPIPVFLGFPVAQLVKKSLLCGRPVFDPWVGKIPWRRERLPIQYCGLGNSMDCIVDGVAKSCIWQRFPLHFTSNYSQAFAIPGVDQVHSHF